MFLHPLLEQGARAGAGFTREWDMVWVLVIGAAWLLLGLAVGVLIGRGVRLADRKAAAAARRRPQPGEQPGAMRPYSGQPPAADDPPAPDAGLAPTEGRRRGPGA